MTRAELTRRAWLQGVSAAAFTVAFGMRGGHAVADAPAAFQPNAWLRLLPTGELELWLTKTEIGQGAPTAMAQVLCAELGADLARCQLKIAAPGGPRPVMTGGSTSILAAWRGGRPAAAAMREGLIQAAAARWGVAPARCEARGHAVHEGGRSLGFGELAEAAAKLPPVAKPTLRAELKGLGESVSPAHWGELVQGKLTYGIDVRLPGQRFAVIARAPRIGAKLLSHDAAAARAVPGVEAVLHIPGSPWPGEPHLREGLAVVARNSWAAQQGRAKLNARWSGGEPGAAAQWADSAALERYLKEALEHELERPGSHPFITSHQAGDDAALQAAFQKARRVLDLQYSHPYQAHAPMEPMNATARFDAQGQCEIWAPSHNQSGLLSGLMLRLQLPKEKITIHNPWVGGSFGRRLDADFAVEAAWIARASGQTVQLLWTRDDDLQHGLYAPPSRHRIRVALDAQGMPSALSHDMATVSVLRQLNPALVEQAKGLDFAASADAPRSAAWPALRRCRQRHVLEPVRVYWWRRGYSGNHCFANESALDEMALAARADPIEYRLRLLADGQLRQWTNAQDQETLDATRMATVLRRLQELTRSWPKARWGVACANLDDTHLAQAVRIEPEGKGWKVAQVLTVVDCGQLVNPAGARAQVEGSVVFGLSAAIKGAITVREGAVQQRNFGDYPLLRLDECPQLEVDFIQTQAAPSGLGEPAAHPTAAALAGALARATGRRQRSLPLRLG